MKILVINGSPKGQYSITLQTVRYLEKLFSEHTFTVLDAGQKIHSIEKDFESSKQAILENDLILFSYPVYTFIATSQTHTFIRLMKQCGADFSNKVASQITTSKHFYDVTAHTYVMENCQDMGMNFITGLSADMDDLLSEKGRKQAVDFFGHLIWAAEHKVFEKPKARTERALVQNVSIPESTPKKSGKHVVILRDSTNSNATLEAMIGRFAARLPYEARVIDLGTFPFRGGCLGCFHCASDGKCIYKDGFDRFLREEIQGGASIVMAFNVLDHSMGPRFKVYDDRQFCNGHRTVTAGMPMGYLVTGDLDSEANLRMIMDGRGQVGGNYIAGIATNQSDPEAEVDLLAENLTYALENGFDMSSNFLGVGGMKIFRDLIYLMGGMMQADYRFYKEHGLFNDFPQRHKGTKFKMKLVGLLMNNPKLMAKAGNAMNEGMIGPYKKVLESVDKT